MTVIGIEPILLVEIGFKPIASTNSAKRYRGWIMGLEPIFTTSQIVTLPIKLYPPSFYTSEKN